MELLVVVAVIVILLGLLLAALGRVRDAAQQSLCSSRLHQVGGAVVGFTVDNRYKLPRRYINPSLPLDSFWMVEREGELVNLGLVMDYVSEPKVFYCVTQTADRSPDIAHDSRHNPWRVGSSGGGGYEDDDKDGSGSSTGGAAGARRPPPGLNSTFTVRAPNGAGWQVNNHSNKVIYTDFIGIRSWRDAGRFKHGLQQPHGGEGYNRLVGNGAVHWLDADSLEREAPVTNTPPDADRMHGYFELLDVLP